MSKTIFEINVRDGQIWLSEDAKEGTVIHFDGGRGIARLNRRESRELAIRLLEANGYIVTDPTFKKKDDDRY